MKKITLSGGFHDVCELNIQWNEKSISKNQAKRIEKHFCGMSDCTCGGPWASNVRANGLSKEDAREFFFQLQSNA